MKNWKTTTIGFIMCVMIAIQPLADTGEFDLKKDWCRYCIAIVIAVTGFFMKDSVLDKK